MSQLAYCFSRRLPQNDKSNRSSGGSPMQSKTASAFKKSSSAVQLQPEIKAWNDVVNDYTKDQNIQSLNNNWLYKVAEGRKLMLTVKFNRHLKVMQKKRSSLNFNGGKQKRKSSCQVPIKDGSCGFIQIWVIFR